MKELLNVADIASDLLDVLTVAVNNFADNSVSAKVHYTDLYNCTKQILIFLDPNLINAISSNEHAAKKLDQEDSSTGKSGKKDLSIYVYDEILKLRKDFNLQCLQAETHLESNVQGREIHLDLLKYFTDLVSQIVRRLRGKKTIFGVSILGGRKNLTVWEKLLKMLGKLTVEFEKLETHDE